MSEGEEIRLPIRPRLADHVMMRRQIVQGELTQCLVDRRTGMLYELTEMELAHVQCLDGTRDFGGVVLAAVQRGAFRRASELQELLGQMQQAGLLADGIAPPAPPTERHPERPLEPLAGYRLHCDAVGSCCTTFASVPFSEAERDRAQVFAPECVPEERDRLFLPLFGSVDHTRLAVTMRDGQCPFLSESARCAIHERGGSDAKPFGCRLFPRVFTDDGEAVRVSLQVECACIMASALANDDRGEALVAPDAKREGDLSYQIRVTRLDAEVAVSANLRAERAALRAWSAAVTDALESGAMSDGVAACWALADAAETLGLDPAAATTAVAASEIPTAASLRPHLDALKQVAGRRRDAANHRAAHDRIRVLSTWIESAAAALGDDATLAARLAEARFLEQEAFYLRAAIWGYQPALGGHPLVAGLRDRAIRLLLARQLPISLTPGAAQDPALAYPITGVEAMMRGQALERYADEVGSPLNP